MNGRQPKRDMQREPKKKPDPGRVPKKGAPPEPDRYAPPMPPPLTPRSCAKNHPDDILCPACEGFDD